MAEIKEILKFTSQRTFDYPKGKWVYYQEWNNALFLHWKVPLEVLEKLVPRQLNIDTLDGNAYVSMVAFTMERIRPRCLPSVKFISDFHEINVRTYIDNDNKKGVYFLNIEAGKSLSALVAGGLSGLPFGKSTIKRSENNYTSNNQKKNFSLAVDYRIGEQLTEKTQLDSWLTERYCLYLDKGENLYRYDIHHKEWEIDTLSVDKLKLNYQIGGLRLADTPDLTHYSKGVKVVAWGREKISK